MKKKILFLSIASLLSIFTVYALENRFNIDSTKLTITTKPQEVKEEFNIYNLNYNITSENEKLKENITNLSKQVTYLLLGQSGMENESAEEYYQRREDYLKLRYNPTIPKDDNSFSGFAEDSQEYKDDIVSGISVPGMFNILNELEIVYNSIGNIRVSINDDMVISTVTIPDIKIKEEDKENPLKYNVVNTNLVIYYYFKKLDNDYKLYYLFAEKTEDLQDYMGQMEQSENEKNLSILTQTDSKLKDIYDFSKLDNLTDNQVQEIYDNNYQNIMLINSYYNNELKKTANGFLLNNGLVVTTWDFLEKSLVESQFITIKNSEGTIFDIEGIVTINPNANLAVIKLKEEIPAHTILGDIDKIEIEDPVITINSKTSLGLSIQKGIVTSKDEYIQSSIPLTGADEGSPLYNTSGQVIGLNTAKSINSSLSLAINSKALLEIQNKFNNLSFSDIKAISFDNLKEKYYYLKQEEEKVSNLIPKSKWNKFKKVGDISNTIKLKLVKASYDDNIISLRYHNVISDYIDNMQLSLAFRQKLEQDGFKKELDSNSKYIYVNNQYKVIITNEFDYLIVVMVKL